MTDRDHGSDLKPAGGVLGHVLGPASRQRATAADTPSPAPAPADPTDGASPDRVPIPFKGDAQPAPTR